MTSSKDLGSLSGSYALNALDPAELAEFEKHLENSDDTRNETIELTDTAVLLGMAVAPVTPSASLKASIMSQLDAHPQLQDSSAVAAPAYTPMERKAQARWFTRPVVVLAAAAASVALIAGGGVIANTFMGNTNQQSQADQFAAITSADDAQRASLPVTGGGVATLVWSNELLSSALIVDGLATLPSDKVYELWYIDGEGARPAGTFSSADGGRTWRVLDGDMKPGDQVGVTVENEGGSVTKIPTTDPIVVLASA